MSALFLIYVVHALFSFYLQASGVGETHSLVPATLRLLGCNMYDAVRYRGNCLTGSFITCTLHCVTKTYISCIFDTCRHTDKVLENKLLMGMYVHNRCEVTVGYGAGCVQMASVLNIVVKRIFQRPCSVLNTVARQ
jgi:hypothetical protein